MTFLQLRVIKAKQMNLPQVQRSVLRQNVIDSGSVVFQTSRQDAGTKAWVRVFIPRQDTGTIGFFIGIHEYEK